MIASVVLMVTGLWRSMFILGYQPIPEFVEDARVGNLYLLGGSAASLAAAVWSFRRGHPHWVTACVAAPAVVVGGVALVWPYSMLRQLVALLALPGAIAGTVGGLLDRGYRRTGKAVVPQQYQGHGSAPAKTNTIATAALITSFFIGPAGVILGHIALHQIKTTRQGGRGLAIAALVVGYASMFVVSYITIGLFSSQGHSG
ncbi:DUF4190 domain-containing protein [Arthrobacter pascens]|uniref:DUF4190 domain-containing protein n=1 Tax=Arthrobacter pascens TaxID=1677 RepID=UPI0027D76C78|nr:DUF4190 domain-containing protein [Arthrobacter pascens]